MLTHYGTIHYSNMINLIKLRCKENFFFFFCQSVYQSFSKMQVFENPAAYISAIMC